jgi:putative sterol carrier protein
MSAYTNVQELFADMCQGFLPAKAQGEKALIQFDLTGDNGGKYWVKVENGQCESGNGTAPAAPDMTLVSSADDWLKVTNGELNAMTAFMQGKIKVQGNMGIALKLQTWFSM